MTVAVVETGKRRSRQPPVQRWWPAGVVILSGLAVGIVTQVLQGALPGGWGVLANSGVMWALAALTLGTVMPTPRWAAFGGAIHLVIASVIYYVAVEWFEGNESDARGAIIWSAAGLVAGSVFGLAGNAISRGGEWRLAAMALVSGVLVGEGVHLTWFVGNPDLRSAGIVELVIAAVLAAACQVMAARSTRWSAPPSSNRRSMVVACTVTLAVTCAAALATLAAGRLIDAVFAAS